MIYRHQQGGQMTPEQQQQAIIQMVQAAMSGNQEAQQQIDQIMQAAQNGDQEAMKIAQFIQEVVKQLQGQARSKRIGGKLAYIHRLRTGVGLDEEVTYQRCGGKVTKKVTKKACGGAKMKPMENGGKAPEKKTYFECKGGKAKSTGAKKCYFGGSL